VTPACLYCGGTDLEPLYSGVRDRLGYVPGERAYHRCRACGSAVLVPLPTTADLPGFYPPVYTFGLESGEAGGFKKWLSRGEYQVFYKPQYRAQARAVARACGWPRGGGRLMLDVGCGRGLRLVEFRRLGFDVRGLDMVPDNVRYLREELGIPAECADITEATTLYRPGTFDLITAFFVIEHVPDVRGALAGMFELLKPNGWLAAAVPLVDSLQARALGAKWAGVTEAPRHLSLPTQRGMTGAFRAAGFRDVSVLPDALLSCSAQLSLSLVTGAEMTYTYGASRLRSLLARAAAGAATFAVMPGVLAENHLLGRPGNGIVVGRKPAGQGGDRAS